MCATRRDSASQLTTRDWCEEGQQGATSEPRLWIPQDKGNFPCTGSDLLIASGLPTPPTDPTRQMISKYRVKGSEESAPKPPLHDDYFNNITCPIVGSKQPRRSEVKELEDATSAYNATIASLLLCNLRHRTFLEIRPLVARDIIQYMSIQ